MLNIEDYRKLLARADTRNVGTLDTMPDDVFQEFRQAVHAYEREGGAW